MTNLHGGEKEDAIKELADALDFFDRVVASSTEERIAVGQDHWNWILSAVRKVVEYG